MSLLRYNFFKKKLEDLQWEASQDLEEVNCNLCQSSDCRLLVVENSLPIVSCKDCGLVYVNPRPTEKGLTKFYDKYFPEESEELWQRQMTHVFEKEGLSKIREYKNSGRILDIGCGYGFFLKLMRNSGWESYGVEISERAANYAQEKLGFNVLRGNLREAKFENKFFDVVTFWYVLEHVPDPLAELREANRVLKEEGLLIVRVPNMNVRIDRILSKFGRWGQTFYLINPPRHLFDYTAQTIRKMLIKAGFGRIKIINSCPRATGSFLELIRRHLWYWQAELIFSLSGGRIIRGSSMTIWAYK